MWLITGLRIQVKSESNIYSETVNIVFSWLTTEDIQLRESDLFTHAQALCSLKLKDQILHQNYVIFIIPPDVLINWNS